MALSLAGFSGATLAQSQLNLLQTWQKARGSDAGWRVAQAEAEVEREEEKKALAGLLPNIGFSASRSRNSTDVNTQSGSASYSGYTGSNDALVLRQPLFRAQNYAEYRRAGMQRNVADHRLAAEEQTLAVRVAQAYFDVLLADDRVRFAGFLESSLTTRVEAARKMFRAGVGTTIDIEEASARLKVAQSTKLSAENEAENARKRLSTLIDAPVTGLAPMTSEQLVRQGLTPNNHAAWQELARQSSPELAAATKGVDAASWGVDKARAGHLPTLDLVAARTRAESDTSSTISSRTSSNSLGLQLNVPIFAGGYTSSETAQARARHDRSVAARQGIERELDARILKEYNGVIHGQQQAEAMAQALQASQEALRQTRKGIEAGTRTNLDVLNAEQQLFAVQVEAAKARYEAAMSRIRLYATAGKLNENELAEMNALMLAQGDKLASPGSNSERSVVLQPQAAAQSSTQGAPQSAREQLDRELEKKATPASNRKSAEIAAPRRTTDAASGQAKVLSTQPAANPAKTVELAEPSRPAAATPASTAPPPAPLAEPAVVRKADSKPLIAPSKPGNQMILVGSFGMQENVDKMVERLEKLSIPAFTETTGNGQTGVRAGPFKTKAEAASALKKLKGAGIEGVVKAR